MKAGKMAIAWRYMRRYRTSQAAACVRLGISQPSLSNYIRRRVAESQRFDNRRNKVSKVVTEFDSLL